MNNLDIHIPKDIAAEVLALAAQYQAEQSQQYSVSDLTKAGNEVHIPSELVQQAIAEVQARRQQRAAKRRQFQHYRQLAFKIGAGVMALGVVWGIWTYNALSAARSNLNAAWVQVENQLQRRADLIPRLIRVTQDYAEHERLIVTQLLNSQQAYLKAETQIEKLAAIAMIDDAVEQFYAQMADHPVQSSQLFKALQYEMVGTENRIAVERQRYNEKVQIYNQQVQQFPNILIARGLGFERRSVFPRATTSAER